MARSASRSRPDKGPPSEFGRRIAKLREERGIMRHELASKAKVTESLLCRLETQSRNATEAETVFRLAKALEVRPEWLWWGHEPRELDAAARRLAEIRKRLEEVDDPQLAAALAKPRRRYHPGVVAVATTFARNGECHTAEGWLARLDEIATKLSPLLPS